MRTVKICDCFSNILVGSGDLFEYRDGAVLVHTTSTSNVVKAMFISEGFTKDFGVLDIGNNFGTDDILCKQVVLTSTTQQPVCIFVQDSNSLLDLTFAPTGTTEQDLQLTISKTRSLLGFNYMLPVYIDFEQDIVAVKARAYDTNGVATSEAMLFYRRDTGATQNLFWGLSPSAYFNELKEGDVTTVSIPVVVASFNGTTQTNYVRFTQTQTVPPEPTSSSSTTSFLKSRRNSLGADETKGSFKSFQTAVPSLDITDKEVYQPDAEKLSLLFNGELGTGKSDIKFTSLFSVVDPVPEDDSKTPWWVWVIIGLVVFLVIVGILLYFLTKNKEEDEENDEYMTPEEDNKDQAKKSQNVDKDFE